MNRLLFVITTTGIDTAKTPNKDVIAFKIKDLYFLNLINKKSPNKTIVPIITHEVGLKKNETAKQSPKINPL